MVIPDRFTCGIVISGVKTLCSLRWSQIDLESLSTIHVNKTKGGIESVHPLHGPERSLAHYLGHRNPPLVTTALAPDRFAKFWKD